MKETDEDNLAALNSQEGMPLCETSKTSRFNGGMGALEGTKRLKAEPHPLEHGSK